MVSRPYYYEDFSTQGYGVKADILQANLSYSRFWKDASLVVRLGQMSTAFGSFLLRYDDAVNPLIDTPMAYGYYSASRYSQWAHRWALPPGSGCRANCELFAGESEGCARERPVRQLGGRRRLHTQAGLPRRRLELSRPLPRSYESILFPWRGATARTPGDGIWRGCAMGSRSVERLRRVAEIPYGLSRNTGVPRAGRVRGSPPCALSALVCRHAPGLHARESRSGAPGLRICGGCEAESLPAPAQNRLRNPAGTGHSRNTGETRLRCSW